LEEHRQENNKIIFNSVHLLLTGHIKEEELFNSLLYKKLNIEVYIKRNIIICLIKLSTILIFFLYINNNARFMIEIMKFQKKKNIFLIVNIYIYIIKKIFYIII